MSRQPWLASRRTDLLFIIGPAFVITAIVVLLRRQIGDLSGIPPWLWLLLIVGVDVSHVYSTIFRTYLDREELKKRQALYTLAPLGAWLAGVMLYSMDGLVFWRVLAYLAAFHFIRQQYGFMMLYARGERNRPKIHRYLDQTTIYLATIFPLVYWHSHRRAFSWFIDGDFFYINAPVMGNIAGGIFGVILSAYFIKEMFYWRKEGVVNIPKNLLLLGTALSWTVGIVIFDNDLAFTATNVVAHGVPYMALIWIYGRNQSEMRQKKNPPYIFAVLNRIFSLWMLPVFIGLLFLLAFIEEGFWDGLVWREHGGIFGVFKALPPVRSEYIMVWLVPLLSLPQAVHYILDAFIWRQNLKDSEWKKILLFQNAGKR